MMIADDKAKADIAERWETVRTFREMQNRTYISSIGGVTITESSLPDEFYNLPLVLAYTVFETALDALGRQGEFAWQSKMRLGPMMKAAKEGNICWENYVLVNKGRKRRNHLAHRAELIPKDDCFEYIGAIEAELRVWGFIQASS